jgi:chromosome segregation ATPase
VTRESVVSFEAVSHACYEILSRGERPTRPRVQDLLATDYYLGRRGSHTVVQQHINDFWTRMSKTLQEPVRSVKGIPEPFVSILDGALLDMVEVARKLSSEEFAERHAQLEARTREIEAAIEEARAQTFAFDQARVRAETALNEAQALNNGLRGSVAEGEKKLSAVLTQNETLQKIIEEKDQDIRKRHEALDAARDALEAANDIYREETHRLSVLVDTERQAARKETKALAEQIEAQRREAATLREDFVLSQRENTRLNTENSALSQNISAHEEAQTRSAKRLQELEAGLLNATQQATELRVRLETTEQLRQETVLINQSLAEELKASITRVNELTMTLQTATSTTSLKKRKTREN